MLRVGWVRCYALNEPRRSLALLVLIPLVHRSAYWRADRSPWIDWSALGGGANSAVDPYPPLRSHLPASYGIR